MREILREEQKKRRDRRIYEERVAEYKIKKESN